MTQASQAKSKGEWDFARSPCMSCTLWVLERCDNECAMSMVTTFKQPKVTPVVFVSCLGVKRCVLVTRLAGRTTSAKTISIRQLTMHIKVQKVQHKADSRLDSELQKPSTKCSVKIVMRLPIKGQNGVLHTYGGQLTASMGVKRSA
jgi:hypothetical protein